MSLLMDALRKAEEAKRAASQSEASGTATVANNPAAPPNETAFSLTPLEPKETTESLAAPSPPRKQIPPPSQQKPASAAESVHRNHAQNLFAAKQAAKSTDNKTLLIALGGFAVLALIGIGTYVWWQLQPHSATTIAANSLPSPQSSPTPQSNALPALPQSTPVQQARGAAATSTTDTDAPATTMPPQKREVFAPQPRPTRATEDTGAPNPIRITRNQASVNVLLLQGYDALQQGKLSDAQQAYERMLGSDPKNLDALYGLAAVAVARQQNNLAEDYYLRIIEIDPRDAIAQAGLADLGTRSSGNTESRLKTLIAEQPNVAQLHLALGNLYAQNQRWRDAQQAYFLAYKNDSETPDIAFNLAVSLDQLHQEKLATQYYIEALKLAATRPSTFGRNQAQLRLHELQAAAALRP